MTSIPSVLLLAFLMAGFAMAMPPSADPAAGASVSSSVPSDDTSDSLHAEAPWWRETFVLSTFAAVRPGDDMDKVVPLLKDLGLNALECNTPLEYAAADLSHEERLRLLSACAAHGLRVFVTDHKRLTGVADPTREALESLVADYASYPALGGYYVWDEPIIPAFPAVRKSYEILRELDPGRLPLVAMVPSYGPYTYPDAYPAFARQFVEEIDPPVISFDYYGLVQSSPDEGTPVTVSPGLYRDLALWSGLAEEKDRPLWFYPSSCRWADRAYPTEATIRFQTFAAVAYGAKGIQYFTVRSFAGEAIDFTHAPLGIDGTPGASYEAMKAVNRDLAAIGPTLMKLRADRVFHTAPTPPDTEPLAATGYGGLVEASENLILGFLRPREEHRAAEATPEGQKRRFLVVVNKDLAEGRTVRLRFERPTRLTLHPEKTVVEAEGTSDDAPHGEAVAELLLPPGGGRLIEWETVPVLPVPVSPVPVSDEAPARSPAP